MFITKGVLWLVVLVGSLCCSASIENLGQFPADDISELRAFFVQFADALNSKDIERIKRMSGGAWEHFSERIDCQEKILGMEVLGVITDKQTNVVTKTTVGRDKGRPRSAEVIFTMKRQAMD